MCGINGIFAYHYAANPLDPVELIRTRDYMAARGPDAKGEWIQHDGKIGFGHRRLSIVDLTDGGAQPMMNASGTLIITFNGEIYNHTELRRDLESKGYEFRSNSDTEVLLHLYADKGEAMVNVLRGMFAFAIYDTNKRFLFLARDSFGIKPLYYADDGWTFRFASQVKALLAGRSLSQDPEPAGLVGFYLWGSVPEPFTTYQAIRALPAGSTIIIDRLGAHEPKRYYSVANIYQTRESLRVRRRGLGAFDEAFPVIRGALLNSVEHHLKADVPVGAFLSAGIDSGALVGLMRDAGQNEIHTVTLQFGEYERSPNDEAPLAAEVARLYEATHSTRVVSRDEFEADLPLIMEAMDQPTIDGVNTWFISKAAHELGLKVAISGLGGDELFGGYSSFDDIPKWVEWLRLPSHLPGFGRGIRYLTQQLFAGSDFHPKAFGLFELGGSFAGAYMLKRGLFMPWELRDILEPDIVQLGLDRLNPINQVEEVLSDGPNSPSGKIATLETCFYMRNQLLRDADWASMAHSLEIRLPLVDTELLATAAEFPFVRQNQSGKSLLASAPTLPLPATVVARAKTGFTTPVAQWMSSGVSATDSTKRWRSPGWPWARHWSIIAREQSQQRSVKTSEGAQS